MAIALWLTLLAPTANLEPGWRHEYQGQLVDRDQQTAKRFLLDCVVTAGGVYWSVDEQGSGEWPWSCRFGKLSSSADTLPSLLFQRDDITAVVELPSPQFQSAKPLASNATWKSDGRTYRVTEDKTGFRVESRDAYGSKEAVVISADEPLIRRLDRDVVVGQGDRLELQVELVKSERLGTEAIELAKTQYEHLLKTRSAMNRPPRVRDNQWSKAQLTTWRENLPESPAVGLKTILDDAAEDVRSQGARVNALKKMTVDVIGKSVDFKLQSAKLGGGEIRIADLRGKVVVLHFWTYHSKPLEEPYGQAGYIDFLFRKLPSEKVSVLGVAAVDPTATASATARDARKFAQFMNLGFPIAVDEGSALKAVGDPRQAGGPLPLVVVLDPGGKVIHYHVGNYEVHPRDGLKELASVVQAAIK